MLLRYLVENYVRQAATDKLRGELLRGVSEALSGQAPAAQGDQSPGADEAEATAPRPAEGGPVACDVVVFFALGVEAHGLSDKLENALTNRLPGGVEHAGELAGRRVVIVETGAGQEAAARAARETLAYYAPQWVLSAGFAGGLADELVRGDFVVANSVADLHGGSLSTGLQMTPQRGVHVGRLLTVDKLIRQAAEKRALGQQHAALACDMETMALAQVCRERGLRLIAVRVVTDAVGDELPAETEQLLSQTTLAGKLGAAARALWQRPGAALDLWKLQEEAFRASERLGKFLRGLCGQLPPGE